MLNQLRGVLANLNSRNRLRHWKICLVILGLCCIVGTTASADPSFERSSTNPTFALYDPGQSFKADGVWDDEVKALEAMFKAYGFSYQKISDKDINAGKLLNNGTPRYKALVEPGGWAWPRNAAVTAVGEASIREFLAQGGNYIGFCAGSYNVAAKVIFAEHATGAGGTYNQASDYVTYNYDLKILPSAQGPFGWALWTDGTNPSLQEVRIDQSIPVLKAAGLPATTRFFYSGGPFFPDVSGLPNLEVWARAQKPPETNSAASTGDGQATIIRYSYGKGSVILFTYHPEVLVQEVADNMEFTVWDANQGVLLTETDFTWDPGSERTIKQVNIDAWNIVHAALQTAAGQAVTPLTRLP